MAGSEPLLAGFFKPAGSGKMSHASLEMSENRVIQTTTHDRENHGAAGRAAAICLAAILLAAGPMSGASAAQQVAANPTPASGDGALPPKAHELLTLLAEEWLAKQGEAKSVATPAPESFEDEVNSAAGAIHDQIVALAGAIPDLPHKFKRAVARVAAVDPDSGTG
jgi:hypothetical protein